MQLTEDERLEAFIGLNDSYIEMESKQPAPPKCHFKTMSFQDGEDESWWECDYCGHTKPASTFWNI